MPRVFSLLCAGLALAGFLLPRTLRADDLEQSALSDLDQDLKKESHAGGLTILLVGPDGAGIDGKRFVRSIPGQLSVCEFPHVFRLEGADLFTAGTNLDASLGKDVAVRVSTQADPAAGTGVQYRAVSTASIQPGKYRIVPFDLAFEVTGAGAVVPGHPALSYAKDTLQIHVVPVTFSAVDAAGGFAVPLTAFKLQLGETDLLSNLAPGQAGALAFCPLTLYLPRGLKYESSAGAFAIDAEGKIVPAVPDSFRGGRFVLNREAKAAPAPLPVGPGYWVFAQNLRQVFKRGEAARFHVIASGTLPAADLPVVVRAGTQRHAVGTVRLPAVSGGTDARLFSLDTNALPPGRYEIGLDHAASHAFAFELVELVAETPLVLQTVGCCNGAEFTFTADGFREIARSGIRCWVTYGHGSSLEREAPRAKALEGVAAEAPPELRAAISGTRQLLESTLRAGLTMIDYENRRAGFYNEGLAFHHSYQPSVERLVRRVQIFMQEVEDYPACIGLTYTWFPCLGGYVEGGVPTDPYFGPRMEALHAKVKAQTGAVALTPAEQQQLRKGTPEQKRAMADKFRTFWRAEQRLGWQDAFSEYNRRLREVRSDYVATTSENTGHDAGKSVADIGACHDAMSFECYTDYGDWPDSAGWLIDWAHGNLPEKPVWFTVDGTQTDPAIVAKAMYAFARGAEGIGMPLLTPNGARSNTRRGLAVAFLKRYGPLVTEFTRESQVAILGNEIEFPQYATHALHSHLMRLGYAPLILSERTIEKQGVPRSFKAVFIPNMKLPFSAACEQGLKQYMSAGGQVVTIGEGTWPIPGAKVVATPLKQLWDVGGFSAALEFWKEFHAMRPVLEKTLAELGLKPPCGAQPDKALIIPLRAGGVRYAAVIAAVADTKDTEFTPAPGVAVQVGAARKVMNLATGEELPVRDGTVTVDLVGEPFAWLALLDAEPAALTLRAPGTAKAGTLLQFTSSVATAQGPAGFRTPVEYVLTDPAGAVRARLFRFADRDQAAYRLADLDAAGEWTLTVKELLTGLTAQGKVRVAAGTAAAVTAAPEVYLPHPERLALFAGRKGEVRVLVEETQAALLPEAERVVEALKKSGRPATLQRVGAESFDTVWLRWFPGPREQQLFERIDKGEVVGYRGNLQSLMIKATNEFASDKGGWTDLAPMYVVRNDAVLFAGGRLADSLRAVSDWMNTPNLPGKGQGIVEVALSPFWADRQAVAIVANDAEGRRRAVDAFLAAAATPIAAVPAPAAAKSADTAAPGPAQEIVGKARTALDASLKGLVPPALCQAVRTAPDGHVAVVLKDATVVVSPDGKPLGSVPRGRLANQIASGGRSFWGDMLVTQRHPGWNFPTGWKVSVQTLDVAKGEARKMELPEEITGSLGSGWENGFLASPDGTRYFTARVGGGFAIFDLAAQSYRIWDEPGNRLRFHEAAREPVFASSARFSENGTFVVYSAADHPAAYGPMHWPSVTPFCSSLRLVRAATGETVWRRDAPRMEDGSIAALNNCLAVSADGTRVAYLDWAHTAVLLDAAGKEIFRQPLFKWQTRYKEALRLPPPWRVELTADAAAVLFVGDGTVLVTDAAGGKPVSLTVPGFSDACLARDGSRFFTADADGLVAGYDRTGRKLWDLPTDGANPKLAAARDGGVLVGTGAGALLYVAADGKVQRTVPLPRTAPAAVTFQPLPLQGPPSYRVPQTLEVLKKRAGAALLAKQEFTGAGTPACGLTFFPVPAPISLAFKGKGRQVVHLVYRHSAKTPTRVAIVTGRSGQEFFLDLPTPEFRVVDLPADGDGDFAAKVTPGDGLEIAEFAVYAYSPPGTNAAYIQPPTAALAGNTTGLDAGGNAGPKTGGEADVLDDKDNTAVASAAKGKLKNCAIFSINPDVNKTAGPWIRNTGNALDTFDGTRLDPTRGSPWVGGKAQPAFGTKLLEDMGRTCRPQLCLTYDRVLTQSKLMQGIAVCRGDKADMEDPTPVCYEPRVLDGAFLNDQFFRAFDLSGATLEVLGVFVFGPGGDEGLSEVEVYE